ncbi:hypothetical protein [Arthrobacter mobilis]|uniref:Lipoprotein n=1 Tax=Arthrobacter mobilis TaxID=2724944 RepID=A0A7X6K801_9MICC|nr:hypothetical protein [Arthrobacter mobilis]NKX56827.1 hypothetical protein [Arthrobacter mobilis]
MRSILAVLAMALLTGCTGGDGGGNIAALEAPRTGKDALPAGKEYLGVVPDSTRLAGEKGGYVFYLARRADDPSGTEACAVIGRTGDGTGWSAGCSTALSAAAESVTLESGGVKAAVVTDGYDPQEKLDAGWEQLGNNLLVLVPQAVPGP